MKATMQEKLRMAVNLELAKRLLIKYFVQKGFADSFDVHVYPPMLKDLPNELPQFQGKIEVEPWMIEIDPSSSTVRVGWNLFVLGTNRMYLGSSTHRDVSELDLKNPATSSKSPSERVVTPRQIITFILDNLKDHRTGYLDVTTVAPPMAPAPPPRVGGVSTYQWYRKNKPI